MILESALVRQARLMMAGIKPEKAKLTNLKETNPLKKSMKVLFNPEKISYSRTSSPVSVVSKNSSIVSLPPDPPT